MHSDTESDTNKSKRRFSESPFSGRASNRRSKDSLPEVRILLHNHDASIIIGRSGTNIKALRNEHKTIIQLPDSDGPERLLKIKGNLDACLETIKAILTLLDRNQRADSNDLTLRLLIHQSHAGAFIGHGGERIKELRKKHSIEIKVFSERCPLSTERIALLKGSANDIVNCLRETLELMEATPIKGPNVHYDPYNFDDHYAYEYGGFEMSEYERRDRGYDRRFADDEYYDRSRYGRFDSSRKRRRSRRRSLSPPQRDVMSFGGVDRLKFRNTTNSVVVTVPNKLIGSIIGPRGSKIKRIRRECGADIVIDDLKPGSSDRVITITGYKDDVDEAEMLLQNAVKQPLGSRSFF